MDKRITTITPSGLLRSAADLLLPRVCVVCGRPLLDAERHLCFCCLSDLPLTHFERMAVNPMADRFNALIEAPAYERATALFFYDGDYKNITRALKYGRNFGAGRHFAVMLGECLRDSGFGGFDAVCCVPLHWRRRFSRGYNQAEIIGREVARVLGVPFEPRLLRRTRSTRTQTELSDSERAQNVAGAFAVRSSCTKLGSFVHGGRFSDASCTKKGDSVHELADGTAFPARLLLIDDVFTTGATVAACVAALREAFGPDVRISVATLAFAG